MSNELTRRDVLVGSLGIAAALSLGDLAMATPQPARDPNLELWYRTPAEHWTDALPIGNGRLGAMIFGGTQTERIQLNETTIWAGEPHVYDNPEALGVLPDIRRLIFEGKIKEAQDIANRHFMSKPLGQMPYQTAGSLVIDLDPEGAAIPRSSEPDPEGVTSNSPAVAPATPGERDPSLPTLKGSQREPQNYSRRLSMENGIHVVQFTQNGVKHKRTVHISDQVIVVRLESDKPASFKVRIDCPLEGTATSEGHDLIFRGKGGNADGLDGKIQFVTRVRALSDGKIEGGVGSLSIENSKTTTLRIAIATNYKSFDDLSADPELEVTHALNGHMPARDDGFRLTGADLQLDGKTYDIPTDERILAFLDGRDETLPVLYFNYGKYLLLSSSRPGGKPANLQGLWNDSATPPWGSKYTININTEMNYWPAETCGLSECHEPLFDMLRDLMVTGAQTAKTHYGARGWVAHHNTDIWRGAAPIDGAAWGIWPTGGAWLSTHIWQHYLFTQDVHKLRRNYPILKGAAEFFVDTLVPHPAKGWMVTCPSASPENSHHPGQGLCAGPTMDMSIIRDLFEGCIEASKVLNTDHEFRDRLHALRAKLAPMQIGRHGQLQEWLDDWDEFAPEQHHRHVSHLYGLFPSLQIDRHETPELYAAARKSLETRGDEGTGWSLAWKINLWARLHQGDHAYKLIQDALRPIWTGRSGGGGVYKNLFDAHPPFQIDGNFGFTSGVAEMLLQSRPGEIELLPALPSAWPTGSVSGLRARGGLSVAIAWKGGILDHALVKAIRPATVHVRYREAVKSVDLAPGTEVSVGF